MRASDYYSKNTVKINLDWQLTGDGHIAEQAIDHRAAKLEKWPRFYNEADFPFIIRAPNFQGLLLCTYSCHPVNGHNKE